MSVTMLALAAPAAAAADPSLIVVGRSIGAVGLGMTAAEVVQALGHPKAMQAFTWSNGERGRVARYTKHRSAYRVSYAGGKVVWIEAASRYYRAATGVGPGSPMARAAALPGFHPDPCTGGVYRRAFGALTLFAPTPAGAAVHSVSIVDLDYYDC